MVVDVLVAVNQFMKVMDIEFEKDFDLNNYDEVCTKLFDFGKVTINNNIVFSLNDIKKVSARI